MSANQLANRMNVLRPYQGYKPKDFYDVIAVVSAAKTELLSWQAQGYACIFGDVIRRTRRSKLFNR